jgi:multidrug resistance efflux pump
VDKGWTPRSSFDKAQQAFLSAQAAVDSAQAQLSIAEDQLSYTVLFADAPGAVTAVGAEPGEVFKPGRRSCNSRVRVDAMPSSMCPKRSSGQARATQWCRSR